MATFIKKCTCVHTFQDNEHGKGNRVFNLGGKKGEFIRCTVCGKEIATHKQEVKK